MKKTGWKAAIVVVLAVVLLAGQTIAGPGGGGRGRGGGRGPGIGRGMPSEPELWGQRMPGGPKGPGGQGLRGGLGRQAPGGPCIFDGWGRGSGPRPGVGYPFQPGRGQGMRFGKGQGMRAGRGQRMQGGRSQGMQRKGMMGNQCPFMPQRGGMGMRGAGLRPRGMDRLVFCNIYFDGWQPQASPEKSGRAWGWLIRGGSRTASTDPHLSCYKQLGPGGPPKGMERRGRGGPLEGMGRRGQGFRGSGPYPELGPGE